MMLEFEYIITNGYVDIETIHHFTEKGCKFVVTLPANMVHPHALPTDKISLFSKYTEMPEPEGEIGEAR